MKLNTNHSHRLSRSQWGPGVRQVLLGALMLGLSGCQTVNQTVTIGDMSSGYNRELMALSLWAIAISIIIFIGVSTALFYIVHKYREENNPNEPLQIHGNNKLEMVLVAVPVVIVLGLSVMSVRTMAKLNPVRAGSHQVDVLAKQYWWNFSYPAAPAAAGGTVANGNELILPAGPRSALTITSGDVVHSFWAPNLGAQRNATPGTKKTWPLGTDKPGVYQGNCSILCGGSHANMRFKVIVLPQDRFDVFMKAAQDYKAPTPAAGSAEERGMNLFMQGKGDTGAMACASCHRVQGTTANGQTGPDLSFFGSRRTLGAGMWEAMGAQQWADETVNPATKVSPKQALHNWIKHTSKVKPGALMPSYDGSEYMVGGKMQKGGVLTDKEIEDIAAYLRSLKLPEEADYWKDTPIYGTGKSAGADTTGGNQ